MDVQNVQGESQQKLYMIANIRCSRALKNGGEACAIILEEDEDIIYTGNNLGKYVVAIDPLDGSSNIDVNVSIGTIFSIYRRITPICMEPSLADFLQGNDSHSMSAATYWFGGPKAQTLALWHEASALTYARPILFLNSSAERMHAGRDDLQRAGQSGRLLRRAYISGCSSPVLAVSPLV